MMNKNYRIITVAKLYEIYSKQRFIIDLLVTKGIMSKAEFNKMLGEPNEQECKKFIEDLFSNVE